MDDHNEEPQAAGEDLPTDEQPGGESRLGAAGRLVLKWAVAFGLAFVLGIAALWIVRLRPQDNRIRDLQRQAEQFQTRIEELQGEVEELESLRQENQMLRQELDQARLHLELLDILVDVEAAQIALERDNLPAAQEALRGTDAKLQDLSAGLEGSPANAVQAVRDRLHLVREELGSDAFAARQDLDIMASNLLDLEQVLFGPD